MRVVRSLVVQALSVGPALEYTSTLPLLRMAAKVGVAPGTTTGSLANALAITGTVVVVVGGFVVVVVGGFVVVVVVVVVGVAAGFWADFVVVVVLVLVVVVLVVLVVLVVVVVDVAVVGGVVVTLAPEKLTVEATWL